jgi:hypothetical protein
MIITLAARTLRRRKPDAAVGWCVRLDWPDGTHCLGLYRTTEAAARDRLPGLRRFWAPGPVRPESYRVVPISRHDCRLHAHRPLCASPSCPGGDHAGSIR